MAKKLKIYQHTLVLITCLECTIYYIWTLNKTLVSSGIYNIKCLYFTTYKSFLEVYTMEFQVNSTKCIVSLNCASCHYPIMGLKQLQAYLQSCRWKTYPLTSWKNQQSRKINLVNINFRNKGKGNFHNPQGTLKSHIKHYDQYFNLFRSFYTSVIEEKGEFLNLWQLNY